MRYTERQQWLQWGLSMQGSKWLLQLRPHLDAASPNGRHFADYVIAARCTVSRARVACSGWANGYTLSDAVSSFEGAATVRDTGEESAAAPLSADGGDSGVEAAADPGPALGQEELDALFLTKLAAMLEKMPSSSLQVRACLWNRGQRRERTEGRSKVEKKRD